MGPGVSRGGGDGPAPAWGRGTPRCGGGKAPTVSRAGHLGTSWLFSRSKHRQMEEGRNNDNMDAPDLQLISRPWHLWKSPPKASLAFPAGFGCCFGRGG